MASEVVVKVNGDVSGLQESLKTAENGIKTLIGAISFGAVTSEIKNFVDQFAEAEEASARLTLSLQNQGIYSKELADQYKETAAALQLKTGYDDDAIIKGQSLLQSFVGQREISEDLTKAVIDLAAATGKDLQEAFAIVGKTIDGNTNALARSGIEIDVNASKQEKMQQIISGVNAKWRDQAEIMGGTLGGQLRITASLFGNLQEQLGGKFAPIVSGLNKVFKDLVTFVSKNDWILTLIKDLFVVTGVLAGVATATYAIITAWNLLRATNPLLIVISLVIAGLTLLVTHWDQVVNFMQAAWQAFADNVFQVADNLFNALGAAMTFDFDKAAEYWANATESFSTGFEQYKATRDELNAADQAEQDTLKAEQDQKDRDRNAANFQEQTRAQEDLQKSIKSIEDSKYQDQVRNNARQIEEQKKFGVVYATINKAMHSEVYQGTKQAFGELAQLQASSNDTLKGIGKVAAIANIVIKTAESAMNIYAGFSTIPIIGPVLGVAGAAAAVAFGAEQISKVNSAAAGGLATGGIPGVDSIPFLLQEGELVTPTKNFEEVVGSVAATRMAREQGLVPGEGGGGNSLSITINGDVLADDVYIDRLVEKISDRVEFGNARLLASEV